MTDLLTAGKNNCRRSLVLGRKADQFVRNKMIDPRGLFIERCIKIFIIVSLIGVSLDPLFFYVPVINDNSKCLDFDASLEIAARVLRSFLDLLYIPRIILKFRTGFIRRSSRLFGRPELIDDPQAIARRYLLSYFAIDILSILPLPELVFMKSSNSSDTTDLLKIMIFLQFLPRFTRIYLLYKDIPRGILGTTIWPVAVFHLYVYMLASHVFGSSWYLFSLEAELRCWQQAMKNATISTSYLNCGQHNQTTISLPGSYCSLIDRDEVKNAETFDFGIYIDALTSRVVESSSFLRKLLYCFLWGLRNISSFGQNLQTSTSMGEMIFVIFISIFSLVFISVLIGNLQTYLSSRIARVEEMMVKAVDIERWMSRRMLPEDLRQRIRQHENFKWQETEGFDEETLIDNLPKDLRKDIKSFLCRALLLRVPMFERVDQELLDRLCYRSKAIFYSKNSYIAHEDGPIDEMLFIMEGKLVSSTRSKIGFSNSIFLREGDFCGEELLLWALDPNSSSRLPISTRTVKTISEVQAFVLTADDLSFVAPQFRQLHGKQLVHTFRFYSSQWRTWAACFIQAAWRRYIKRKHERSLREAEDKLQEALANEQGSSTSFGSIIYASRFATTALRTVRRRRERNMSLRLPPLLPQKPAEPNFLAKQE